MKPKSEDKKEIIQNIRFCIRRLHLPLHGEERGGKIASIFSKVELEMFSMNIEVRHFAEHEVVSLGIEFSHAVHQENLNKIYDLMNRVNHRFMDIASFSVWPPTGEVSVHAGIHVPGNNLNSELFRKSLERLLDHGFAFYGLIVRADVTEASPREIVDVFIRRVEACAERRADIPSSLDAKDLH